MHCELERACYAGCSAEAGLWAHGVRERRSAVEGLISGRSVPVIGGSPLRATF